MGYLIAGSSWSRGALGPNLPWGKSSETVTRVSWQRIMDKEANAGCSVTNLMGVRIALVKMTRAKRQSTTTHSTRAGRRTTASQNDNARSASGTPESARPSEPRPASPEIPVARASLSQAGRLPPSSLQHPLSSRVRRKLAWCGSSISRALVDGKHDGQAQTGA